MTLAPGTRIGPYEVIGPLGAGGMGEVYRARDTNLDRDVALKILPEAWADDVERLARFEREAKTLAALNHPNIAQVYGLEALGSTRAIAMEFVEGRTLDAAIGGRGLSIEDALPIARQIADALEAAHEQGIVHRDLKPANVMLTADDQVKVLDFGLATAMSPAPTSGSVADSPTMTARATQLGMIIGTAAYMSPEQAKGKPVDKRADIWSFGVVLFEMLTGRTLFAGETVSETLADVLKEEVPWARLPQDIPDTLVRLLKRCLVRDPRDRLRDIGEARLALREDSPWTVPAQAPAAAGRSRSWWPVAAAAVVGALATMAIYTAFVKRAPVLRSSVRATIEIPAGFTLDQEDRAIALSTDGTQLALVLEDPATAQQRLFVRSLDRLELRPLADTEGASYPFWSPDGRALGFFAESRLKRIDLNTGIVRTLAEAPAGRGGAWSARGFIVFQPEAGGALSQVPADGGAVTPFTTMLNEGEDHRLPHFLPDGRRILFQSRNRGSHGEKAVYAFDPDRGEATKVLDSTLEALFVEPDSLVFAIDDNLMSQPFDPERLTLSGSARPIVSGVHYHLSRHFLSLGLASNGRFVYGETPKLPDRRLFWLDRDGTETRAQAEPINLGVPAARVSPDGQRLALSTIDAHVLARVQTLDFGRGTLTPVGPRAFSLGSAWSTDGSALAISAHIDGHYQLTWTEAQAGGEVRPLTSGTEFEYQVGDFTPDGRSILFGRHPADKLGDILLVDIEGTEPDRVYLDGPGDENNPRLSPDGRLVAYLSDATGGLEVWVADFPSARSRRQVSTRYRDSESGRSGETVRFSGFGWMGDDEVYWRDLEGQVRATRIRAGDRELEIDSRRLLFEGRALTSSESLLDFSVARQKFLLARADGTTPPPRLVFVSDWRTALGEGAKP